MNCELESRLSAYHDNELSPVDRAAVAAHLEQCAGCRSKLASIRETSELFAASIPAGLSQIARHRLHRNVERQLESGLVRLSWAMSGIAAAIMVVGTVWLKSTEQPVVVPGGAPQYVTEASTPAEQYYLADARIHAEEW